MQNNSQQDIDLLRRVDMLGKKIALLEQVSSEILTSLNHLTDSTKSAYSELQSMQTAPAQTTLLQLQEENQPLQMEIPNVEVTQEKTGENEQSSQDAARPTQADTQGEEVSPA